MEHDLKARDICIFRLSKSGPSAIVEVISGDLTKGREIGFDNDHLYLMCFDKFRNDKWLPASALTPVARYVEGHGFQAVVHPVRTETTGKPADNLAVSCDVSLSIVVDLFAITGVESEPVTRDVLISNVDWIEYDGESVSIRSNDDSHGIHASLINKISILPKGVGTRRFGRGL